MRKTLLSFFVVLCLIFCLITTSCSNGGLGGTGDSIGAGALLTPKYNVKFYTNGGTPVATLKTDKISTAPATTKSGYDFIGWYLDENFEAPAIFPMNVEKDTNLYAKWIQTELLIKGYNFSIKMWTNSDPKKVYDATADELDFEKLADMGYYVKVEIKYDVYYERDYNLDLGYAGAPKYELMFLDDDLKGLIEKDLTTTKSSKTKTFTFTQPASFFEDTNMKITFSTDNIQNTIYFKNISVTYTCIK